MKKKKSPAKKTPSLKIPKKEKKEISHAASGNNRGNKNKKNSLSGGPFPIVGIGASAGGLEALGKFFPKMPAAEAKGGRWSKRKNPTGC